MALFIFSVITNLDKVFQDKSGILKTINLDSQNSTPQIRKILGDQIVYYQKEETNATNENQIKSQKEAKYLLKTAKINSLIPSFAMIILYSAVILVLFPILNNYIKYFIAIDIIIWYLFYRGMLKRTLEGAYTSKPFMLIDTNGRRKTTVSQLAKEEMEESKEKPLF